MPVQFKDLRICKKTINFINDDDCILLISYCRNAQRKAFLNILANKAHKEMGKVFVNNSNITDLLRTDTNRYLAIIKYHFVQRKTFFIKSNIFWRMILDSVFLQESVIAYYLNSYQNTVKRYAKREFGMSSLFEELDGLVRDFMHNFRNLEQKWVEQFQRVVSEQYKNYLSKHIIGEANLNLMIEFLNKKMNIAVNRSRIIFLQSLWDRVNGLNDLVYNCRCYKTAKKQKLDPSLFVYQEIKIIADKYLKTISWEIMKSRFSTMNNKKMLKKYLTFFRIHKMRFHEDFATLQAIVKPHHKVNGELEQFLQEEQKNYDRLLARTQRAITTLMPDEMSNLANKIAQVTHRYHLKLLASAPMIGGKTARGDWKVFHFFTFFKIVNNNFDKFVEKHKITLNKFTKSNFYDNLKIRLLISFILNKELVVFDSVLSHLNHEEIIDMFKLIKRLNAHRETFNVIFINKNKTWLKTITFCKHLPLEQ